MTTRAARRTPADANAIASAVDILRAGGVVAIPTETVYGLGADARNEMAVRRVFAIKGRPADHPLIVHLADAAAADAWAAHIPAAARQLMARFWPGPLTLVLPARGDVPRVVTGGQDSVALRVPNHPTALAVLRAFGGGLAAPSANPFGGVSPTEAEHVRASLGDRVDLVLDGGPCRYGLESTIVSFLEERPRVLRPGALALSALREVLGAEGVDIGPQIDTSSDATSLSQAAPGAASAPRVPGALPAHYAPATPLEVLPPDALAVRAEALLAEGLRVAVLRRDLRLKRAPAHKQDAGLHSIAAPQRPHLPQFFLPARPQGYAHGLYARLRQLDRFGFDRLLVEAPPTSEAWWAVNDRLARAACAGKPIS